MIVIWIAKLLRENLLLSSVFIKTSLITSDEYLILEKENYTSPKMSLAAIAEKLVSRITS